MLRLTRKFSHANITQHLGTVSTALGVIAIFCTVWWFFEQRELAPKINIKNSVTGYKINKTYRLVYATTTLENKGKTGIKITYAKVRLQQVLPLGSEQQEKLREYSRISDKPVPYKALPWPPIGPIFEVSDPNIFVEPGEEVTRTWEFIIPANIELVRFYCFFDSDDFRTSNGKRMGWDLASFHDLKEK